MQRIVVHYNEIGLKGKNQPVFVRRLAANLRRATAGAGVTRVEPRAGRMVLDLAADADAGALRERLRRVFGVANFAFAERVAPDMEALKAGVGRALEGRRFASFRVSTRRAYKPFPRTSEEINRELGAFVLSRVPARVDLERPELTIHVEVLPRDIYFSLGREAGAGGLPVGVSGRVVALLSGGIDSPVAALRLMKRACQVVFVHFHSFPFQDGTSRAKAEELARLLTRYQYRSRLYLVPFGEVQRAVVVGAPEHLRVILYRRLMARIAERIAQQEGARALVTGESLGQVASQTLDNLAVIEQAVKLPVLRPLIGSDKEEIVQQARALGSYDISILPDQDCCSLFVPRHPATTSRLDEVERAEAGLDVEQLVKLALAAAEVRTFRFPEAGASPPGDEREPWTD
ncbi:MAG: tRNA uracil 4-sulfurtransferase ThiI [Candidatus Methylomirabilales bacterium]